MVCELYKKYVHPLARVVRGLPISWGPSFATAKHLCPVQTVAYSSCSRFIAVDEFAVDEFAITEVLDAVTLERLHTFTHPFSETGWLSFSPDSRSLTRINEDNGSTTWDLQTGGQISATPSTPNTPPSWCFSSTYSMDGKIVAAAHRDLGNNAATTISTYDVLSGTHIYSHRISEGHVAAPIWTHGESLRFAVVNPGSITIWQVGFTSEHTLAEIESLPGPDDIDSEEHLFLPTLSRLAFTFQDSEEVLVWDARDSKFLLNFVGGGCELGDLSFSSDGRFFACGSDDQEVHLWKESPTGYVLHQKLASGLAGDFITPFLSPDGESIITSKFNTSSDDHETQLWRTTDPINPSSSIPSQPADQTEFVLAFSPDKSFIATGRLGENIATIVDLKSGDPRLIVDTGMEICGLGVTARTVIVVGEGKIITWNLPAGDCALDARANILDSVRTIVFDHPPPSPGKLHSASISPDFNHLAITRRAKEGLDIYDMSTGNHVVGTTYNGYMSDPWFTRDGREVWDSMVIPGGGKIIRGEGTDIIGLERLHRGSVPSGGYLWESSHGHNITDDGWILDSRKKRVMWLPHHWRVYEEYQVWDGQFLALFDPSLPEPVIIELYE